MAEAKKQLGEFRHYKSIDPCPLRLCDPSSRTIRLRPVAQGVDVRGAECYLVDPIDRTDEAPEKFLRKKSLSPSSGPVSGGDAKNGRYSDHRPDTSRTLLC